MKTNRMTFADIVNLWLALPRWPDSGIPISGGVGMMNFPKQLMSPEQRGWFKACHAWVKGGPAPNQFEELDEILNSLTPYQRNVALAHLECARLALEPCNQSFECRLSSAATKWNLHRESLRELVIELRLGRPRQAIGDPVYITYPVVSSTNDTARLARFMLERLDATENRLGNTERLFPAPAQIFSIEMDQAFQNTFTAALESGPVQTPCEDVRVSIELIGQETPPLFMSINGTSGGGALAIGLAKVRTCSNEDVEENRSKLRTLEFNSIAVTAELGPKGQLIPVGSVVNKSWAILITRKAEIHEINVLVVAEHQGGFGEGFNNHAKRKYFLLPTGNSYPRSLGADEELRSPKSLLVIRAASLSEAIDTLHQFQINTLLTVLEQPHFIIAYLLAGNRWFLPVLLAVMFAAWLLLPDFWFVLLAAASVFVAVVWVHSRIKKVKRQSEFYLQQRELSHSAETWAAMVRTLQSYQSSRLVANICGWLGGSLIGNGNRRLLPLKALPWIWYRNRLTWLHLFVLVLALVGLATPLQHCLAEAIFPGTARILRAESRRGNGNNFKYASAQSNCGGIGCSMDMTVGSYGSIRLFLEHKDRSARYLSVTCTDEMSYVKVDDSSAPANQLTVPIVDDQAKFYYGIDENTPWEIELEVEVLCYCNGTLEKLQIVGHRTPPGE